MLYAIYSLKSRRKHLLKIWTRYGSSSLTLTISPAIQLSLSIVFWPGPKPQLHNGSVHLVRIEIEPNFRLMFHFLFFSLFNILIDMERRERTAKRKNIMHFVATGGAQFKENSTHFVSLCPIYSCLECISYSAKCANICIEYIVLVKCMRPFTITPDKTIFFALVFFYRLVAFVSYSQCLFNATNNVQF